MLLCHLRYLIIGRDQIYVYPIKSLRGTQVPEALATKNGFAYDRMSICQVWAFVLIT
jgi:hypothetical protein